MKTKLNGWPQNFKATDLDVLFDKKQHGGARKGAGRPAKKEPTVVMRIPVSKVEAVKKLIARRSKKHR
jgi:predicted DNA binding CopG/RHH family protein